jgi:hypothetical protein
MARRFTHEDVATVPRGWKVRTVTRGSHRVRIAFPPGPRQTGAGRLIAVLHPRGESQNPCRIRYLMNPAELLIMGANPSRPRRPNPHTLGREISRMKDRGASGAEVGRMLSRATNPNPHRRGRRGTQRNQGRLVDSIRPGDRVTAYDDGFKAGQADRRLGVKLEVSWHSSPNEPKYQQEYSRGYRDGWQKKTKANPRRKSLYFTVKKVTEAIYREKVIPMLTPGYAATLAEYKRKHPGTYYVALNTKDGRVVAFGSRKEVARYLQNPVEAVWQQCPKCGQWVSNLGYHKWAAHKKASASSAVRNPGTEEAAGLYQQFHGRAPKEILELQEPEARGVTLTSLGDLIELQVVPLAGRQWVQLDLSGDRVKLAANAKGTQLYFIGGNQTLTGEVLRTFGSDTSKELVELGQAATVVYRAKKSITDFKTTNWEHSFGEESGMRPILAYDVRTRRLLLVGGEYKIEAPGIIN